MTEILLCRWNEFLPWSFLTSNIFLAWHVLNTILKRDTDGYVTKFEMFIFVSFVLSWFGSLVLTALILIARFNGVVERCGIL